MCVAVDEAGEQCHIAKVCAGNPCAATEGGVSFNRFDRAIAQHKNAIVYGVQGAASVLATVCGGTGTGTGECEERKGRSSAKGSTQRARNAVSIGLWG